MSAPAALVQFLEPWSHLYGDSTLIATIVEFSHIAALVLAGGLAVTLDRATLRAVRAPATRSRQLDDLAAAHKVVVTGLAFSVVTGLLLFTADIEAHFVSWIFWTKMGLVALLLSNGYVMTRTEADLRLASANADRGWGRLRISAVVSLALWFAIAFAGVALVNAG